MADYIQSVLDNISDNGMTPDLWDLINNDVGHMRDLGISNDKEKALLFYIRRFLNDILAEIGIERQGGLANKVFGALRYKEKVTIEDIKKTVIDCLKIKQAYPNIQGVYRGYGEAGVDINKWINTMGDINKAKDKNKTLQKLTADWNETEKYNFIQWMKYYEDNNHMKYGFDKEATSYLDLLFDKELEQTVQDPLMEGPELEPEVEKIAPNLKKEQTLRDYRKSLISRLMSAEKLLAKFSDSLSPEQWSYLYNTLSKLKGEIIQLKVADSINDCVIRTAAIFDHNNFAEGADELRKVAAPAGELAKRINVALTGAGAGDAGGDPTADFGMGEGDPTADFGMGDEMAPDEEDLGLGEPDVGAPPEVAGGAEEVDLEVEEPNEEEMGADLDVAEPDTDLDVAEPVGAENPFSGSSSEDVVNLINPLLQNARSRANVRILTKADMMLEGQGVAGYLPELGEAIMKQIECDNYIANRLEKIIGKLQGGKGKAPVMSAPPAAAAPAPSVDMEEITGEADIEVEEPIEELPEEPPVEGPPATPEAPGAPVTPTDVPVAETTPAAAPATPGG